MMFSRPIRHQWTLNSDSGPLQRGASQWFAPPAPTIAYDPYAKDITLTMYPQEKAAATKVTRYSLSNTDLSTTIFAA